MDVMICVMLPPRGATDWDTSAHPLMPVLNVVCVFPRQTIPEVAAPRTGYIHITGVPDQVNLKRLQELLSEPKFEGGALAMKRVWSASPLDIPVQNRNELLANRQTTMTFAVARDAWKRRDNGQSLRDAVS